VYTNVGHGLEIHSGFEQIYKNVFRDGMSSVLQIGSLAKSKCRDWASGRSGFELINVQEMSPLNLGMPIESW